MTGHDPLCDSQPEHFDGSILWPERCTCDLIVKVRADEREKFIAVERFMTERGEVSIPKHIVEFIRADEREKAAQRVERGVLGIDGIIFGCPFCGDPWESEPSCEHWPVIDRLAASVRGES